MDRKPNNLSLKSFLIKKMLEDSVHSEHVIKSVINHQFESALNQMGEVNSVEISGLGRWYFSKVRARKFLLKHTSIRKRYKELLATNTSYKSNHTLELIIKEKEENISYLRRKLNETITDDRGMEE